MDIDQERTCDFKSESDICLTRVAVRSGAEHGDDSGRRRVAKEMQDLLLYQETR